MKFKCSVCKKVIKPLPVKTVYFICSGFSNEPVPDNHKRLRCYCSKCALKKGISHPKIVYEDGTNDVSATT